MKNKLSMLIVDDELSVRDSLLNWFATDGYDVECAEDAVAALKAMELKKFHIILIDIKMPGMDGLELHRRIKANNSEAIVIIMTAFASVDSAVEALKDGAYDYICKPFDPDQLTQIIRNASQKISFKPSDDEAPDQPIDLENVDNIIGNSPAMMDVFDQVKILSGTDSTVIITGESGTGKELIAHAIHINSNRRYFPMVIVHCGALAETILESELFGHERGAFTGASYHRKGKFEMANGGTLFLDEIATVSSKMQIELLRVLECKSFTRVGGNKEIHSDFRVIAATNRDLKSMVKEGHFREDLYYRLNVFDVHVPTLRERQEDISDLVEYFIKKYNKLMNRSVKKIDQATLSVLMQYSYPGNVRELENIIERAIVLCKGDTIKLTDIPIGKEMAISGIESIAEIEKNHLKIILEKYDWNISKSAKSLGIDRATLYNKINKYGILKT
ncbi:MAG: sigma-54-dependent Fis family transcriptional regulator [Candidatus Marinimicrobia bacterium]|nr:sigma-54-dependent Fis family transcriptional regulator [Candidatus Neomarinimicrobiota bacterium]